MVHAPSVPEHVPGVSGYERVGDEYRLMLEKDATPQAVLRALLEQGVAVESFGLATLPLEDIFVKVVRDGLGLDGGQSGPPTVDEPVLAGGAR
jgi:hypothetical protein